jgi:hypothetical protein
MSNQNEIPATRKFHKLIFRFVLSPTGRRFLHVCLIMAHLQELIQKIVLSCQKNNITLSKLDPVKK